MCVAWPLFASCWSTTFYNPALSGLQALVDRVPGAGKLFRLVRYSYISACSRSRRHNDRDRDRDSHRRNGGSDKRRRSRSPRHRSRSPRRRTRSPPRHGGSRYGRNSERVRQRKPVRGDERFVERYGAWFIIGMSSLCTTVLTNRLVVLLESFDFLHHIARFWVLRAT